MESVFFYSCAIRRDKFIFLLFFIIPALFTHVNGQAIQFKHYAVDDGLTQSVILSVFQDSEGFIWIGTQSGLNRFNGYEFDHYYNDPLNSSSLTNNWIYDIAEDSNGILYLATKGGLNSYNKKTGEFSQVEFSIPGGTDNNNFIYGITCRDSLLFISTPPVLTIYNTRTSETRSFLNNYSFEGMVHDLGSPVLCSRDKKIWVASHNGLSCFNRNYKQFENITLPKIPGGIGCSNNITSLFEEENGNILVGTENGLFMINSITGERYCLSGIMNKIPGSFIRDIVRDGEGNLWIATEGAGLNKCVIDDDYNVISIINYRSSQGFISHDIVYSLFVDPSENLWVGTLSGIDKANLKKSGISRIANTGEPESFNILDNVIASMYKDHSGRLWIGNWGKGLNILAGKNDRNNIIHYKSEFPGKKHIPENHVHLIFEDAKAQKYIATRNGISVFRESDQSFIPVHEYFSQPAFNCFENIRVYCIMDDRRGKLWVGTGRGIIILNIVSGEVQTLSTESESGLRINSNLVYSIMEDSESDVWIATSEGLNVYKTFQNKMFSFRNNPDSLNSLCNNFTVSLYQDNLGYIWIGTGSGLNRYSKADSVFDYYSRANGLPSEMIYNIIGDNSNRLWFTTGRGLASIDPQEAEVGKFKVLDQLKGKEFNLKAVYKAKDGELFFGGMDGLYSFYPDSLVTNSYIPPVRISSIEKENNGILYSLNSSNEEISLTYRDYAFTIEFSSLDYTSPEKNRYMYKMEGLSDKWINLGERRFVHFTNLPAGSYIFMVKGSNSDGVWNEEPASLKINISPPWWASRYAYIAYFLILVLSILFIISYRESALKREKNRLEKEVSRRTSELAKQKRVAEDSEQKLRSTVNSLDDILFVLDENGKLLEFYNPKNRQTHFINPQKHIGKHYSGVNFPDDVVRQFRSAFDNQEDATIIHEFDHRFTEKGMNYWYNTKISPKINAEGKRTGFVIVAREITDRKESEELLKEQKEKLDELNTAKDRFFSILAHDLKNPFTNLHTLGEILVTNYDQLDESDKKEALKKIHKSSGFIFELLENLLTWSRSQRGKIEFNPVSFDFLNILDVNLNLLNASAEKKGIRIVNEVNDSMLCYGDREMINTIMRNLLSNAVKFSREGGQVAISATNNKTQFVICVRDTGVGISSEDQEKLFRLDEKYKSTGTAGETGTGLGLVLCKEFIDKHGERIWCESKEGQGSSFYFTIPVSS
jgi:PAS domain S-box-containing protein